MHFVALCFRCQISASKVWASAQKAKFSVLGVKVIQRSRLSPFAFSNSFAFLASLFFFVCLFAGHLLGFTLVEKAFRFFDGRKGSCTIFAFFSPECFIQSCSFWCRLRTPFNLIIQVRWQHCLWLFVFCLFFFFCHSIWQFKATKFGWFILKSGSARKLLLCLRSKCNTVQKKV